MSQEKVDYKKDKKLHRKELVKKERRIRRAWAGVAAIAIVAVVAIVGVSAYQNISDAREAAAIENMVTTEVNTTAIREYEQTVVD